MTKNHTISADERERRWAKLHQRIADVSYLLIRQGSLASGLAAGKRVWFLRFFEHDGDRRRQRGIYVGSDVVLVGRARELLRRYRKRDHWVAEVAAFTRLAATLGSAANRLSGRHMARGWRRII